jgi:hypothetical protein
MSPHRRAIRPAPTHRLLGLRLLRLGRRRPRPQARAQRPRRRLPLGQVPRRARHRRRTRRQVRRRIVRSSPPSSPRRQIGRRRSLPPTMLCRPASRSRESCHCRASDRTASLWRSQIFRCRDPVPTPPDRAPPRHHRRRLAGFTTSSNPRRERPLRPRLLPRGMTTTTSKRRIDSTRILPPHLGEEIRSPRIFQRSGAGVGLPGGSELAVEFGGERPAWREEILRAGRSQRRVRRQRRAVDGEV